MPRSSDEDRSVASPATDADRVRALLRGHGLRSTAQRLAVLDLFADAGTGEPSYLTPGQAHDLLRERGDHIDRATVYRTLSTLANLGVLHVVAQPPSQIAYGLGARAPHRAVCRSCGEVTELPAPVLGNVTTRVEAHLGFTAGESAVTVLGICPTCRQTQPASTTP